MTQYVFLLIVLGLQLFLKECIMSAYQSVASARRVQFVQVKYHGNLDTDGLNIGPLKISVQLLEKIQQLGNQVGNTYDFAERSFEIILKPTGVICEKTCCCFGDAKPESYTATGEIVEKSRTTNRFLDGEEISAIASKFFLQFPDRVACSHEVVLSYKFG